MNDGLMLKAEVEILVELLKIESERIEVEVVWKRDGEVMRKSGIKIMEVRDLLRIGKTNLEVSFH